MSGKLPLAVVLAAHHLARARTARPRVAARSARAPGAHVAHGGRRCSRAPRPVREPDRLRRVWRVARRACGTAQSQRSPTRSSTRAPAASPRATRRTSSRRKGARSASSTTTLRPRATGSESKDFHSCSACANVHRPPAECGSFEGAAGGSGACVEANESTPGVWNTPHIRDQPPLVHAHRRCRRRRPLPARRRQAALRQLRRARATAWPPPGRRLTAAICGARARVRHRSPRARPRRAAMGAVQLVDQKKCALQRQACTGNPVTPSAPPLSSWLADDQRGDRRRVRRRAPTRMPTRPGRAARRWCTCSARRAPRAPRRACPRASCARCRQPQRRLMPPPPSPRSARSAPPRWARVGPRLGARVRSDLGEQRTLHRIFK